MPRPDALTTGQRLLLLAMFALSAAVRLHNVAVFPELRAPDGFGHFTYIWHLASTGRIPLATAGWSFFHPPLYYAWMAGVWNALPSVAPVDRLAIGTAAIAMLVLVHTVVALALLRSRLPGARVARLATAAMSLFLPVQLFSAGYLGNEALGAVLCTLSLPATIAVLRRPTLARAATLGLVLGAAMMTKFTALAFVAGSLAVVALRLVAQGRRADAIRAVATASVVIAALGAPFYGRNLVAYGNPFQMSRDTLAVRRVENIQSQGHRSLAEYLLFDPVVFVRPTWPRGIPLTGEVPPEVVRSPLRESVWTGVFANTFFDAVGGQVLPLVTDDEPTRRSGQALLTLAALPSLLVLLGLATALRDLLRGGWRDEDGVLLTCFAFEIGLFVLGTLSVPMHAAVKATYLAPGWAMFAYWFGRGLDALSSRWPRLGKLAVANVAVLCVASVVVFTFGAVIAPGFFAKTLKSAVSENTSGVIAYAGGDRDSARRLFALSAAQGWHLGHENLAAMDYEDGDIASAIRHLEMAAVLQPPQSFGLDKDRADVERITQAEYANSLAVFQHALGRLDEAMAGVQRATELDLAMPEAAFDEGVLLAEQAVRTDDASKRKAALAAADEALARALSLDAAFHEARRMLATTAALAGRCDEAKTKAAEADRAEASGAARFYPVETGIGDLHASALHRRRHIEAPTPQLAKDPALLSCLPARD